MKMKVLWILAVAVTIAFGLVRGFQEEIVCLYDRLMRSEHQELPVTQADLEQDLKELSRVRHNLSAELHTLDEISQNHEARQTHASQLVKDFRRKFQRGNFPIIVRRKAYTREQAELQVGVLLGEMRTASDSLQKIRELKFQAEEKVQRLSMQESKIATELATLPVRKSLITSDGIESVSRQRIAELDKIRKAAHDEIRENPVRSLEELLEAESKSNEVDSLSEARRFLRGESFDELLSQD